MMDLEPFQLSFTEHGGEFMKQGSAREVRIARLSLEASLLTEDSQPEA